MNPVTVLSVAGSDSGGGAGIQADLKTTSALGAFGTTAITAITAQNTMGVLSIQGIEPSIVGDQIKAVFDDFTVKGVKVGMLYSYEITAVVVSKLKEYKAPHLVVDPVMVATSGSNLILDKTIDLMMSDLLPIAELITPNIPEMETLTNMKIDTEDDIKKSCQLLHEKINTAILLKGGHRQDQACDILFDGHDFHNFSFEKIETKSTHGTGCTLSSAITTYLAQGHSLYNSVKKAKDYVTKAIFHAYPLGQGHGPLNHFWHSS